VAAEARRIVASVLVGAERQGVGGGDAEGRRAAHAHGADSLGHGCGGPTLVNHDFRWQAGLVDEPDHAGGVADGIRQLGHLLQMATFVAGIACLLV
jgi:hypothetical protein